jgi:hypothetical protein
MREIDDIETFFESVQNRVEVGTFIGLCGFYLCVFGYIIYSALTGEFTGFN